MLLACPPLDAPLSQPTQPTQPTTANRSPPLTSSCLELQLLALEALRTWRVCAGHGIALLALDDMYGSLCRLLTPPVTEAETSDVTETVLGALLSCEAYQLLTALLRHSVAVAGGDRTLGRPMLR